MSQIHGKDTKPEAIVRKYLFSHGFRYRKNEKRLPGKPDIVLPKYHTVIFVNGCFWHGHEGCHYFKLPKSNTGFWEKKIRGNVSRDKLQHEKLEEQGWRVLVVWECELKGTKREITLKEIIRVLEQNYSAETGGEH